MVCPHFGRSSNTDSAQYESARRWRPSPKLPQSATLNLTSPGLLGTAHHGMCTREQVWRRRTTRRVWQLEPRKVLPAIWSSWACREGRSGGRRASGADRCPPPRRRPAGHDRHAHSHQRPHRPSSMETLASPTRPMRHHPCTDACLRPGESLPMPAALLRRGSCVGVARGTQTDRESWCHLTQGRTRSQQTRTQMPHTSSSRPSASSRRRQASR